MNSIDFLTDQIARPWSPDGQHGFVDAKLFVGCGANGIEIAFIRSPGKPSRSVLTSCWSARRGRRAAPVLLVAIHPSGVMVCGPTGEKPPVYSELKLEQVERLCREALVLPDRHSVLRYLAKTLPSLESELPGLSNEGLLSLHELRKGVPAMDSWDTARPRAAAAVGKRDDALLRALGYQVERIDNLTSLLRCGERRTALAVMLRDGESPEAGNVRFNSLSPISYALKVADDENLSWVILTQGTGLRLYPTAVNAGVGRRGRTETWIECQAPLLSNEQLPYLWLLYSAEALTPGGSLQRILEQSERFAGDLADKLRERIYGNVVPLLAKGIADAQQIASPCAQDLAQLYEMALTVLFRLLFIAYAEDRDLLPYRVNSAYRRRSLKQKAQELSESVANNAPIAEGGFHWQEAARLWEAVAKGNSEWGVPAYNGGLFSDDAKVSQAGALLAKVSLPNSVFEQALRWLLVTDTPEGTPGPVDFRSLGVREFGTIYEGLLESELAVARTDLIYDKKGVYKPARPGREVVVAKGEVYLHNKSGTRKSTGSYYTKSFAVDHLLDGALEPALDRHFARLGGLSDDTDAAEHFLDFRVADIAMGSGHFLVSAIDRIEKRMADYLVRRPLLGVTRQLATLRTSAQKEAGEPANRVDIEDGQLLRRLIARRCIYGVDINPLAVQLSRLAVWLHTFVPGLPLSFLDRNLVRGNALVGVGTLDEIRGVFEERGSLPMFPVDADVLLGDARKPLKRLAKINDATLADIDLARQASTEAQTAIVDTKRLCDLIAARPIANDPTIRDFPLENWATDSQASRTLKAASTACKSLERLYALHFPIAFPEVFLRDRPGFDVVLGNPPWQEATVEEDAFWARHYPGLRGRPQREQEVEKARLRKDRPDLVLTFRAEQQTAAELRKALTSGAYPGMGTGDPDLYKAFCWRFWKLATMSGGQVGVVLPRSALAAKGSTDFRQTVFRHAAQIDIVTLLNRAGWVFDDAEHRYTVSLICISHGKPDEKSIRLRGPFASVAAFQKGIVEPPSRFATEDVLAWNDTASLPLLPTAESMEVFAQLRSAPRLDLNKIRTGGGG